MSIRKMSSENRDAGGFVNKDSFIVKGSEQSSSTDFSVVPTTSVKRVFTTSNDTVIVETTKDVYVNTYEEITQQKFVNNVEGATVSAGSISNTNIYTPVVNNLKKLGFKSSDFSITDLGNGTSKIGIIGGAGGATGATGATGISGYSGARGATGATGISGISGARGATGISGFSGLNGITSLNSLTGAITLSGGTNITIGTSGNTLTICSSGGNPNLDSYCSFKVGNGLTNSTGVNNFAFGCNSLTNNTTGTNNIAIGKSALNCNTSGTQNIALGCLSLQNNQYGSNSIALGQNSLSNANSLGNNIGIGCSAGSSITTGVNNTIIGSLVGSQDLVCTVLIGAGTCERIKVDNTGLSINGTPFTGGGTPGGFNGQLQYNDNGVFAGVPTTNYDGTAINFGCNTQIKITGGCMGQVLCTDGTGNLVWANAACGGGASVGTPIALGTTFSSTLNNTRQNTALGYCALRCGTATGCGNTAIGNCALAFETTGQYNVAIGPGVMRATRGAYCNVGIGYGILSNNTSGSGNIAIGSNLLCCNTIGSSNIVFGKESLTSNTSGSSNISIGQCNLFFSTTGSCNIVLGQYNLYNNGAGSCNIAIGIQNLYFNTTGLFNIGIGYYTLTNNFNGICNIAIGYKALYGINLNGNIGIGNCAGCGITTGRNNTVIGGVPGTATMMCTVLIASGACERIKVDDTGLYINGSCWNSGGAGGAPATPTARGTVYAYTENTYCNTNLGYCSGNITQTGRTNIAIGFNSLKSNLTGSDNIAIGSNAYQNAIEGCGNIAIGTNSMNSGYGQGSMSVAIGFCSLYAGGGSGNIALGAYSLMNNSNGTGNVAVGIGALCLNSLGQGNIAVGTSAMVCNQGTNNIGIGIFSLGGYLSSTNSCNNIGIGNCAGRFISTGCNNLFIGDAAGNCIQVGSNNTVIGALSNSCDFSNTLWIGTGSQQRIKVDCCGVVSLGANAFYDTTAQFFTTYCNRYNFSVGSPTLGSYCLTTFTGSHNVNIGYLSLNANCNGSDNLAVGRAALTSNILGNNNIAFGAESQLRGFCGENNVSIGVKSLYNLGESIPGTCTLCGNVAIGALAGCSLYLGCNNVFIGFDAQPSGSVSCDTITLGNSSITCIRSQVTTISSLSDARDKTDIDNIPLGLDFILNLRPVKFTWNMRDGGKVGIEDSGFIAQEVAETEDKFAVAEWLDMVGRGNPDKLEVKPGKLIPILVRAIQELYNELSEVKAELNILKNNK